ncbi:hypothetical protein HWV62_25158 [Athelia sp. TMB]|nr:hypothetical protein HWV62_25158 [Athelia sp. TMB]
MLLQTTSAFIVEYQHWEGNVQASETQDRLEESFDETLDELRGDLAKAKSPRLPHELILCHVPGSASGKGYHGLFIYVRHSLFDELAVWQVFSVILANIATALGHAPPTPLSWGEEHARLARALPDRTANTFEVQDMAKAWPLV